MRKSRRGQQKARASSRAHKTEHSKETNKSPVSLVSEEQNKLEKALAVSDFSVKAPKVEEAKPSRHRARWPERKDWFLSVNLIPKELVEVSSSEKKQVLRHIVGMCFFSFALLFGSYLVLDYFEKKATRQFNNIDFSLKEAQSKIGLFQELESESRGLQNKIKLSKYILGNHVYWNNALGFLEKNTIPTVYYRNLSSNVISGFSVTAIAIDYESVARQLLALQKSPLVEDVTVASITLEELDEASLLDPNFPKVVVKFDMNIKLDPRVYLYEGSEILN